MGKPTDKQLLKRKEQIENEITNLEKHISGLEWERREIINYLNLNKGGSNEKFETFQALDEAWQTKSMLLEEDTPSYQVFF